MFWNALLSQVRVWSSHLGLSSVSVDAWVLVSKSPFFFQEDNQSCVSNSQVYVVTTSELIALVERSSLLSFETLWKCRSVFQICFFTSSWPPSLPPSFLLASSPLHFLTLSTYLFDKGTGYGSAESNTLACLLSFSGVSTSELEAFLIDECFVLIGFGVCSSDLSLGTFPETVGPVFEKILLKQVCVWNCPASWTHLGTRPLFFCLPRWPMSWPMFLAYVSGLSLIFLSI